MDLNNAKAMWNLKHQNSVGLHFMHDCQHCFYLGPTEKEDGEQIIVFLYDTEYCQHESDDPQKAVLYFHPKWVSDQQRLALCGQLMGVTHFCSSMFSPPNVLTLQSGKFVLKKFGRYVLSVGSDQSLPEWILKERFRSLHSLIRFYHNDLETISASVNRNHEAFINRIAQILDHYIPILQTVVSSVGSVPSIQYSKGCSSVFLGAMELLEACSANDGVSGGVILHNGRVVSSQLDVDSNLLVALTDPYRMKGCSDNISVPFHLPVGVQLLKVFVQSHVLLQLKQKSKDLTDKTAAKLKERNTKRNVGKIFTLHEEEPWSGAQTADIIPKESAYLRLKQRRNSRNRFDNSLKERSKNFKANPNITVCSTPTVEKKLIHEELLSICSGKIDTKTNIPDLVQDVIKSNASTIAPQYSRRRISLDDQMVDLNHRSFPVLLRYYSFGLPRIYKSETDKKRTSRKCKTIADPLYPVFREDGVPVTKGLYNHCLNEHYKDYLAANRAIDSREEFLKSKNKERAKVEVEAVVEVIKPPEIEAKKVDQKLFRRSLTLPLKPLTLDGDMNSMPTKSKALPAATPSTPLLTKLSLLTLEEQHLPDNKPTDPPPSITRRKEEKVEIPTVKPIELESKSIQCSLFVCGHRNMTLILLLDEGAEQNPDLVLLLWELGTSNLERIESLWERSMDHVTQNNSSSSYSFLSLDPAWGTIKKHGPWGQDEMKVVGSLHQDLLASSNITELIVRSEDSVVYGYRCGTTETFYQQGGCTSVGLPTPADLMGVVTLKARRRLERDHGVVLL